MDGKMGIIVLLIGTTSFNFRAVMNRLEKLAKLDAPESPR